ncbi:MAG: TonB-dependent receptor [Mangrovibacterium sp.]
MIKLLWVAIVAGAIQVSAGTNLSYSQTVRLNLKLSQVDLEQVIWSIKKQTEFNFFYSTEEVRKVKDLNINLENVTTEEVLDQCLQGTNLTYEIVHQAIIIKSLPASKKNISAIPAEQPQKKGIKGSVTDGKGLPIPGAAIIIKGTTIGTVTNLDGNFTLQIPLDAKILSFSFVGYETQEVPVGNKTSFTVVLEEQTVGLEEVVAVGYGVQKKETLTGSISTVQTDALLRSPNASVANTLAGQLTGLSSVQSSGQPGKEDPAIYIRGLGSLSESASRPLILVDGVERAFFQMDPNEIESVSVLKDASATAVFGVRGANGVILVTTRRGVEGAAKIAITSSVGIHAPTRIFDMADSYTYATVMNEMDKNDGKSVLSFDDYTLERFRLGDEPIMYPNVDWRRYIMNKRSIQTQHNINISGGTEKVRYFISMGFLFQNGLFKQLEGLDYDNNYKYKRYNYRTNLDIDITPTTLLGIDIGGIIGNTREPITTVNNIWYNTNWSTPFSGPGIIDGKLICTDQSYFPGIKLGNPLFYYYGKGYRTSMNNKMNLDLSLKQALDFLLKGLSFEIKGAYNTMYNFDKSRTSSVENYTPFYASSLANPGLPVTDPEFDKSIVYRISDKNSELGYSEDNDKARDWYFEVSIRYNRKFGNHNVSTLFLYNQNKKYYPSQFPELPTAYVGFVGRQTYDYKSKFMAEFNIGYNGSENFAPGKRFGIFPAGSMGYVLTEENFMKNQKIIDYLKLRASVGLVGNDNMSENRYLYLPNVYGVDLLGSHNNNGGYPHGYNFGTDSPNMMYGAVEKRLGNPDVTWETSLKKNAGIDIFFLGNRLKITADIFREQRKDILINRGTIPAITALNSSILPVVNMGKVNNQGYEIEVKWSQNRPKLNYWITGNLSYAKNKIIFQDEVEPNEPYMWRTGRPVGERFGYVSEGFYSTGDFNEDGTLISGLSDPKQSVYPGDVKYKDLNDDGFITPDDVTHIGNPNRPAYVAGINYGIASHGFTLTMNWAGAAKRSLLIADYISKPFGGEARGLFQFHADERWTPETAETATMPRVSAVSLSYNYRTSSLFIRDGSYIRLKNVSLSYHFSNKHILKQLGISQLAIQLTGYNLITFDKFKLMDPESNPNSQDTYPIVKIYNLGVNITF